MNKILSQFAILIVFGGTAFGIDSSISWVSGDNPPELSRLPANPTTNDSISFVIPTDVFRNRWRAEQILGGKPTLIIDSVQRRIDLKFVPPAPTDAPTTYDPVSGLQGHFGPLEEGWWTFFVQFSGTIYIDPFRVVFAPASPIISGRVHTSDGVGIGKVILIFDNGGGVAITTDKGDYALEVPHGWSGTATPFKDGFVFEPPDRSYSNVVSGRPNQDYEGLEVGPPVEDFFTEQFVPGEDVFDLTYKSILFLPTPDGKSYTGEIKDISHLPADPVGGIDLGLGDDDFRFVKLTGSETVSIYGRSFNGIYVGSNGYITFTEGDRDFAESLERHFNLLRVSGLFRDLNPSAAGQVSWTYTSDGVAVTWWQVPEFGRDNSNTFQIELSFDGRIRMSWLEIEARGGIVGLSEGKGAPPDFMETDLSELSKEPPPPPQVKDFLTEEFLSDETFDLEYASVMFTPTSDRTSYTGVLEDITRLPTDPTGGKNLKLGDDRPVQVLLRNQARVRIFDDSFSTFWVGPNGYITFTRGDNDFSQTLEEHFEILRISGLYTDLTAENTGAITGKQLFNRVAITWQAVPQFSNTRANTFQIEMFFDGRIRLSWLEIGAPDSIVGLSNGLGLSPDFEETDFSERYAKP
ncbi:MAG: hypothetical protein ACYTE3_08460 [Planctomycetota bacterium]|jgi:hypothetical protein